MHRTDKNTSHGGTHVVDELTKIGHFDHGAAARGRVPFTKGARLEVSTDPEVPTATWAVTMRKASGGGFAFWSRRKLEPGAPIFVREFAADGAGVWLAAHAVHTTRSLRGYLIGATLDSNILVSRP